MENHLTQHRGAGSLPLVLVLALGASLIVLTYLLGTLVGRQQARPTPAPVEREAAIESLPAGAESPEAAAPPLDEPPTKPLLPGKPPVVVLPPVTDVGEVEPNAPVTAIVHVYNNGEAPLVIANYQRSRECAFAHVPQRMIAPHNSVPVTLALDTRNYTGRKSAGLRLIFEGYEDPVDVILSAVIVE